MKKQQKQNSEKANLVAQIKAIDPKSKVTTDNSRDFLRGELAKLKTPMKKAKDELPQGFKSLREATAYFSERTIGKFESKNVGNSVTKFTAGENDPVMWFNSKSRVVNWTGIPVIEPAPAPKAPKVTPAPAPAPKAPPAPPAPAPKAPPAPPAPPAPKAISLVRDDATRKRYVSKTDPGSKYHLRDRSAAEKPVSIVRRICAMNPELERKAVISLCVDAGINKNTAATQYSLWKTAERLAALAACGPGESVDDNDSDTEE